MKIGIIGAMELEIESLHAAIEGCKETKVGRFVFYEGTMAGTEVVLLLSGIGKVSAAVGTALLIQRFAPDLVVNTSTAGGLGDSSVYDLILASEVAYHDVDVTAFGYAYGQQAQMPPTYHSDETYTERLREVASKHSGRLHFGEVVSGDSFISDPERLRGIEALFPKAKAVEMEAAAIAQTCYLFAVPFVMLRAVSDKAGEGNTVSYDTFVNEAGRLSAAIVKDFIVHSA